MEENIRKLGRNLSIPPEVRLAHTGMDEASPPSRENEPQNGLLQFKVVETTLDNKNRLLQKGMSASRDGLAESETILARLTEYNANAAQDFGFKDKVVDRVPLKFIREIYPQEQQEFSENAFESYIALSYCWHSHDWTPAEGLDDLLPEWPISPRMVRGLLAQRVSSSEGIWIDQRCIDQSNESEKMTAIGAMDLVFKCARLVVVVIEDIMFSGEEETVLRRLISTYEDGTRTVLGGDLKFLSQILIKISEARWFKRAWCSHELQVGTDFKFLFPTTDGIISLTMDAFDGLYFETTNYIEEHESLFARASNSFLSYEFLSRARDASTRARNRRSFAIEFTDLSELQCSVQTDMISICINVAGLQLYYKGEEKSKDQCRWLLAMIALCAGDATVLGGIQAPLIVDSDKESWMCTIGDFEDTMTQIGETKLQDPPCIASITPNKIILDLLFLPNPRLELSTPQHYLIVLELLNNFVKTLREGDGRVEGAPSWTTDREKQPEEWGKRTSADLLACSLGCGLEWMINQISGSALLAQEMRRSAKHEMEDLMPFLRSVLTMTETCERDQFLLLPQEKITQLLQYFFFILYYGVDDFEDTKWGSYKFDFVECARVDLGNNEKALMPQAHEEYRLGQQYVWAVPVAMSNPSCANVRRLWILERGEGPDRNAWHIVDKQRLFTLIPIRENGRQVIRRNNQVIR